MAVSAAGDETRCEWHLLTACKYHNKEGMLLNKFLKMFCSEHKDPIEINHGYQPHPLLAHYTSCRVYEATGTEKPWEAINIRWEVSLCVHHDCILSTNTHIYIQMHRLCWHYAPYLCVCKKKFISPPPICCMLVMTHHVRSCGGVQQNRSTASELKRRHKQLRNSSCSTTVHSSAFIFVLTNLPKMIKPGIRSIGLSRRRCTALILARKQSEITGTCHSNMCFSVSFSFKNSRNGPPSWRKLSKITD